MTITYRDLSGLYKDAKPTIKQVVGDAAPNIGQKGQAQNIGLMRNIQNDAFVAQHQTREEQIAGLIADLFNTDKPVVDVFKGSQSQQGLRSLKNTDVNAVGVRLGEHVAGLTSDIRPAIAERLRQTSQLFAKAGDRQSLLSTYLTAFAERIHPVPVAQRGSIYGNALKRTVLTA